MRDQTHCAPTAWQVSRKRHSGRLAALFETSRYDPVAVIRLAIVLLLVAFWVTVFMILF